MEQTPTESQHTKLTLEKKILPQLLPGFELTTFRSRVRRSDQQAIPAPLCVTDTGVGAATRQTRNGDDDSEEFSHTQTQTDTDTDTQTHTYTRARARAVSE